MSLVATPPVQPRRFYRAAGVTPTLGELRTMREAVAGLVEAEPVYLPIFERLDAEIAALEAADPIARARAMVAAQKAMA